MNAASIADMIPEWYEGGTTEQMLDEALSQIRILERERDELKHDLERAMANHNADING